MEKRHQIGTKLAHKMPSLNGNEGEKLQLKEKSQCIKTLTGTQKKFNGAKKMKIRKMSFDRNGSKMRKNYR